MELPATLCWTRLVGSFFQMLLLLASFGIERQTIYPPDFSLQTIFWKWFCLELVCGKLLSGRPHPPAPLHAARAPEAFLSNLLRVALNRKFFDFFSAALFTFARSFLLGRLRPAKTLPSSGMVAFKSCFPTSLAAGATYFRANTTATRPNLTANAPKPPNPNKRAGPPKVLADELIRVT